MSNNLETIKNNQLALKNKLSNMTNGNTLNNKLLSDVIFDKVMYKVDAQYYCENVLRAHLPENRRHLHENQTALLRAVANPYIRRISSLQSRQAGKTETIASFSGYLCDNYSNMKIGIFTPRIQQAEISIGRVSVFYQMNEERLNNEIVKCNKGVIQLSNNSTITAYSGADTSNIEGVTCDVIILDEAQKISDYTWSERIVPMGGATNAKLIKIGTPKFRNHFYDTFQNKSWFNVKRDWTQCAQLYALDNPPLYLPDHDNPSQMKQYSRYVFNLMPKALKKEYWPNNPETWTDGDMSIEDFKTQYMLEFVDGAGTFLTSTEIEMMTSGDFPWIVSGVPGERYYAGIDFAGASSDGDFTHITVIRLAPNGEYQKVYAEELSDMSYPDQVRHIARLFGGPSPRFKCKSIFADQTGCGAPIIQMIQQEYGIKQLQGIVFNAADRFTNSGMNMKNIMYAEAKTLISQGRFKYPSKEMYMNSTPPDQHSFYHKMMEEWSDLEFEANGYLNKRIAAPIGEHDDCPSADVLACFAVKHGNNRGFNGIRPSKGRMSSFLG